MLAETYYIILSTTLHCWGPFSLISHIFHSTYFGPPNHVFPTMHTSHPHSNATYNYIWCTQGRFFSPWLKYLFEWCWHMIWSCTKSIYVILEESIVMHFYAQMLDQQAENMDSADLKSFIQAHVPEARLKEAQGGDLVYLLPSFSSSNASSYHSLLTALDANLDELHLGGYGISDTTLEEVTSYKTTRNTRRNSCNLQILLVKDKEVYPLGMSFKV